MDTFHVLDSLDPFMLRHFYDRFGVGGDENTEEFFIDRLQPEALDSFFQKKEDPTQTAFPEQNVGFL
jgi:hypothetical protein